ncbi:hypothetical protein NPIL_298611 [Nephila pilipes]|uniref:Uncharacterized protein n=1 Tax=Nephila pilipes TaxID=299642 RepID=A0A8X6Q270_NEPPI|nr:hypothetical protein NPIL_298611 [Nephila pilipes]
MDPSNILHLSPGSELISFHEALELTDHRQAAHCSIYTPCSTPVLQHYVSSALISSQTLQMHFSTFEWKKHAGGGNEA